MEWEIIADRSALYAKMQPLLLKEPQPEGRRESVPCAFLFSES